MSHRIGLLLPRSTDYPSMGFDMLNGMRCQLASNYRPTPEIVTENIGYGTDHALNYSRAEKLYLQDNVDALVVYAGAAIAESLYQLADTVHKPIIVLDPSMQVSSINPSNQCFHISLQGIHACRIAGQMAGTGNRRVLIATSFYDGGYRGPWSYDRGLSEAGGSTCGNYVSGYKEAEFTIDPYLGLLHQSNPSSVAACFSSYLAELFFKALAEKKSEATPIPFYCSPFMAEEQLLSKCLFPGGEFYAVVPWLASLENSQQTQFKQALGTDKPVNIFHLLGWEAGIVLTQVAQQPVEMLQDFSYESPRGKVSFHPQTRCTYSPLYKCRITADVNGKCTLEMLDSINIDEDEHLKVMRDKPDAQVSGWRNNYLCI